MAPAQSKQEVWYVYTEMPLIRSLWTAIIRDWLEGVLGKLLLQITAFRGLHLVLVFFLLISSNTNGHLMGSFCPRRFEIFELFGRKDSVEI